MKAGKRTFAEAGGPEAYFGDPAAASAAEGEWLFQRLVALVREAAAAFGSGV
jgi:creatinine amidohydrolase